MAIAVNIWNLFDEAEYEKVFNLVKVNNDLINASDERGNSLLSRSLYDSDPGDECQSLLEFLIKHPQLKWENKGSKGESNLRVLISSPRTDLLILAIKNPQILIHKNQLAYEHAVELLDTTKRTLQNAELKNSSPKRMEKLQAQVNSVQEAVAIIRDATILRAIATDDVKLLMQLEQAGTDPTDRLGKLGNGKYLNLLVTPANKNINEWLQKSYNELVKIRETNPNGLFAKSQKVEELKTQRHQIEQQYLKELNSLVKVGFDMEVRHWDEMTDLIKKRT